MARFQKQINLDPNEVRNMDLSQKQDCMSEIESIRGAAWKYSVIFCIGTMLYIFVYSMFSLLFTLRFMKTLDSIHPLFCLIPIVIFVPSFFAHSMNGNAILCAMLAYMLTGFLTIISASFVNAWIFPFAFAGTVFYFRLSRVCETYEALSKEDGFPEFCAIESMSDSAKEIIERNAVKEEPLHPLTEMAITLAKRAEEKAKKEAAAEEEKAAEAPAEDNAVTEEKSEAPTEEKPVEEAVSPEPPAEERPAEEEAKSEPPAEEKPVTEEKKSSAPSGNKNRKKKKKRK